MTEEERNALVVILGAAVLAPMIANWLAKRVRLPSVVLEIVLGIVIGPFVLGWVRIGHLINVFATIGMLFLFAKVLALLQKPQSYSPRPFL